MNAVLQGLAAICLAAATSLAVIPAATAAPVRNIVLVHGAWADGAGWQGVYDILVKHGYKVSIVSNPLTTLADDVAATNRVLDRQDGPVLLVAHSYGGDVITQAGVDPKVVGLVYIAAFVPDVGESALGLLPKDGPQPPLDITKDGFAFFKRDAFIAVFADGLPSKQKAFLADEQVPLALAAGSAPMTQAAWKTKPSWYLLATHDQIIPPAAQRQMATRAGATIVEVDGGHLAFIAKPKTAAALIETAAKGVGK